MNNLINSKSHHSLTVEPDSEEDDDLIAIPQSQINLKGKEKSSNSNLTNPKSNQNSNQNSISQSISQSKGFINKSKYQSNLNTLDEPITQTFLRDLSAIGSKIFLILYPAGSANSKALLRDWDLWGPLVACLGLAVVLSINAPPQQSLSVFTGVFVIVWVGSVVVTLNARLLGGKVSLFQSLCVLGYCLFPLFIAALVALFIRWLPIRILLSIAGWTWSVWAAMNFFGGTRLEDGRAFLAVYPLGLFYAALAWITMLS
ncbi:hypothetical protein O181_055520 [Austropuccinia psidii MF-1]|uniref:Protein YIP n=1 Tax=Austropuccinia psidii MF-1 TaxID=1389203 RepID=A0A9Q3E4G0_9BASI|nr:hypothetical protein [Austropuccinia psidii MF-1]